MSLAYLFKNAYLPDEVMDLAAVKRPFLGLVPKNTSFGYNQIHNWKYARPAHNSATFSNALSQQYNQTIGVQIMTQPSQRFSILQLDAKEAKASLLGDMHSYVSTKKNELMDSMDDVFTQIDVDAHGAGNGIMGQVSAINGTTITLTTASIMNRFMVGFSLQNSTTYPVDGSAPTIGTFSGQILDVNFQARTLIMSTVAGLSVNDYILFPGDGLGFTQANKSGALIGMDAWVPGRTLDPNENFLGIINRNQDRNRLAGMYTTASGQTAPDAIMFNVALTAEIGGRPDYILLNPTDWQRFAVLLQTQVRYENLSVGATSFETLKVNAAGLSLNILSDPHQQRGMARILTMDTWELGSLGDLVDVVDDDGIQSLRDPNADSFQIRCRSYPQLRCFDPRSNGVVTGI